jgi:hypothetical protein
LKNLLTPLSCDLENLADKYDELLLAAKKVAINVAHTLHIEHAKAHCHEGRS